MGEQIAESKQRNKDNTLNQTFIRSSNKFENCPPTSGNAGNYIRVEAKAIE